MTAKHAAMMLALGALCGTFQAQAQYTNLHSFSGPPTDGRNPVGDLLLSGTTLYGMTQDGGSNGKGVIFKVQSNGTGYTILRNLAGYPSEGAYPYGSFTLIGTTLYGLASGGGTNGGGVLFSIQIDGSGYTNLHVFSGGAGAGSGRDPLGTLTLSSNTFYGMTELGGVDNLGVIFRVQTDGSGFTNLHEFAGGAGDGGQPWYGPLLLSGTSLYGMTHQGGSHDLGVIFRIQTDGSGYTNLHEFAGGIGDGSQPFGGLTLNGSTLYGMTSYGGTNDNGVLFQIQTDGSGYTNLHEFPGTSVIGDGGQPMGSLLLSSNMLFGMTEYSGAGGGMIFKINLDGSGFTDLYDFGETAFPYGSLTLSGSTFFGMTLMGGTNGRGSVFAFRPNLNSNTTVQVAVQASPLDGGSVTGGGSFSPGDSTPLSATASNGWQFVGWNDGATNNPYTITVPASDITYTATFLSVATISVAANTNIAGSVSGGGMYFSGSNAVLGATASNGWQFVGWNDGATNNPYTITVPVNDVAYTATFQKVATVTVLVSSNLGGIVSGGGVYFFGSNAMLTATASNGWRFVGWSDGATDNPYAIVAPSTNITYTALFAAAPAQAIFQDAGGQVASLLLNSDGSISVARLLGQAGGWQIKAAGDIDGDDVSDLIFQDAAGGLAIWFLNPDGSIKRTHYVGNVGGWLLRACGDYTGDGHSEIFFQDPDGNTAYWQVTTNGVCTNSVVLGNTTDWVLKAAGDVDLDGKADLFFQRADGTVAAWLHNPDGSIRSQLVGTVTGWDVCAIFDVDSNGIGDLLWQSPDGRVGAWFMNTNGTANAAGFLWSTGGWKLKAAGR